MCPAHSSRIYTEKIPKTAISQSAFDHASDLLAPCILSHSRSIHVRHGLAEHSDSIYAPSAEKHDYLVTACLFHDIGTADEYAGPQRFEVEGADAAVTHLAQFGVHDVDKHHVWTAVACHTSPQIAERMGELSELVRLAVVTDFGCKSAAWGVLAPLREEVEKNFERAEVEKVRGGAVVVQARRRPEKAPMVSWPGVMDKACLAEPEWCGVNKMF